VAVLKGAQLVGGQLNKRFLIVGSCRGDLMIAVVWNVTPFGVVEILPFWRNLQLQVQGRRIMNVY
jgi:hypothetical protein